jgi:hypothetical protein
MDDRRRRAAYRGRQYQVLLLLLGLGLLVAGCAPALKQLQGFKQHWSAADYQWIARQDVQCQPETTGCNQLHLIKGDACFRLAKQGQNQTANYTCAADHLEQGIGATKQWTQAPIDLHRTQTYENLCESLRNLQDLQQGAAATATGERFLAAAEVFVRLEPEHVGAVYYAAKARFRALQPALFEISDANRTRLCQRLADILSPVEAVMTRAEQQPATLWQRYEAAYRLLKSEVTIVQQRVLRCR